MYFWLRKTRKNGEFLTLLVNRRSSSPRRFEFEPYGNLSSLTADHNKHFAQIQHTYFFDVCTVVFIIYAQYRLGKHVTRIIVIVIFFPFTLCTRTRLYGTIRMSPKCAAKQCSREHAQMCDVINFFVCFKRKFNHILILLMVLTVVCCSIISKYNNILALHTKW